MINIVTYVYILKYPTIHGLIQFFSTDDSYVLGVTSVKNLHILQLYKLTFTTKDNL